MRSLMENVNFHDAEVLSIKLDYIQKMAILFVLLDDTNKMIKMECHGLYAFMMSCLEPWGKGSYIFSLSKKIKKDKIKIDILFNSGDHIVVGCKNITISSVKYLS